MTGIIAAFILILIALACIWGLGVLVALNRAGHRKCSCGRYNLLTDTFTQYNYDDAPVYVHSNHRCYPFLEEIV